MAEMISVQELYRRHQAGERLMVLDVRTPMEYRECHAAMAVNRPLESLNLEAIRGEVSSAKDPVFVLCKGGTRSKAACEKLRGAGLSVVDVEGGTEAWIKAGLPVTRGRKAFAVDRQMRILAGSLVVLGVALAPIHWGFVLLSGFVGCGLIFAGATDICPMMTLLARAPWNQLPRGEAGTACNSGSSAAEATKGCCS